jgi:SAM-dependent methyltransferase
VRNTGTDAHVHKYGDLYGGRKKSEWRVCTTCGFVHQNPRPTLESLNAFYAGSKYHTEIPREWEDPDTYLAFARWYYDEKIDFALRHSGLSGGAAFDVGAGHGGVMRLFRQRGWRAEGVEPDGTLFAFARDRLGLDTLRQGFLDESTEVAAPVDLVFSNHTFEHVADLHGLMRGLQRVLRPGGFVFTAVPTYYRNRSRLSLRWMNAAHYSMFTHRSLSHLFSHYGLEEVAHTYRGWSKEIDDLWHVARYTGVVKDPAGFFEDWRQVRHYVNVVNPLNTVLHAPGVALWQVMKSWPVEYVKLLVRSPRTFFGKAAARLRGARRGNAGPGGLTA